MDLIKKELQDYAELFTSPEDALLNKINRDTNLNVLNPRMLSGHHQGRLLAMISKMIRPQNILEIGTYTGYSALCLAEGLVPQGIIITIDINVELEDRVRGYFRESPLNTQIDYRIGNARFIIPILTETFDLVFIDADKESYCVYYDLVFDKVRSGGFILADNVLWSGKVVEPDPDKDTRAIQAFNEKINSDVRVENLLLPVRDGVMIVRKK